MKIHYNVAAIMAKAHKLTRDELIRDQQFISIGRTPPPSELRSFAYNLKLAWRMARCGKYDFEAGYTAGSWLDLIIVTENDADDFDDFAGDDFFGENGQFGVGA